MREMVGADTASGDPHPVDGGTAAKAATDRDGERAGGTTVGGLFNRFAKWASNASGRPFAFATAFAVIVVWAVSGPIFRFNDTWQLAINTGTTIVTFLMVFLIQNSQNRDTVALQVKLDELIHVIADADDRLLDLEELDEAALAERRERFEEIARRARRAGR